MKSLHDGQACVQRSLYLVAGHLRQYARLREQFELMWYLKGGMEDAALYLEVELAFSIEAKFLKRASILRKKKSEEPSE